MPLSSLNITFYTQFSFNSNEYFGLNIIHVILGIAGNLLTSVAGLALIAIPINEAKVAFNRMYEFASIEKEPLGNESIKGFESLKIINLSFRFAGRSQLLKSINLEVNKNECVAIVGESGCGKSTLGQIIQKFYPFQNGTIILNNKQYLKEINTESWPNMMGVIPQDITIFNGNIIDNILLGKDETAENIAAFCKDYGFEKFITELPQGYATILGEEGINLSGGQKQLLAFMRVLYKKPQLLLLDEFTSAMDRNTERFVLELLIKLKQDMDIIFISHRLHTLKQLADRIYITENGHSNTFGTHQELIKSGNFYGQFWKDLIQ